MARRALLAAAVLVAMLGCAAATTPFDGGFGCKYYNIRDIRLALVQQDPAVTEDQVNEALKLAATNNNYLCRSCKAPASALYEGDAAGSLADQAAANLLAATGRSICRCTAGYGYSFVTTTNANTGINKYTNFYGCTKCPSTAPNSNPTTGPYRPGSLPTSINAATGAFNPGSGGTAIAPLNRWINTPCTP